MRLLPILTIIMSVMAGCGGEHSDLQVDLDRSAIVNGQKDDGHPAVGLLKSQKGMGYSLCTATLVGSQTVLTAAHCVHGVSSVSFEVGGQVYQATKVTPHPSYNPGALTANDVAVVVLGQKVTVVKPMMITKTPPQVGQPVTVVGFGITASGYSNSGTKRVTQNNVASVKTQYFSIKGASGNVGNICQGDSGGPSFRVEGGKEILIGVHSTASMPCGATGNDMRVDHFHAWISAEANGDLVVPDSAPPTVTIASPVAGATVDISFTVKASATDKDSGVKSITLFIDGKQHSTSSTTPATFSVSNLAPGPHNLRADAQDKAGNKGSTLSAITVKKSAAPPNTTSPGSPQTPPAGTLGATCTTQDQCSSKLCAADSHAQSGSYCTRTCSQSAPCPAGFECTGAGNVSVCAVSLTSAPRSDNGAAPGEQLLGSCSVTGQGPGGAAAFWPLALLLAIFLRRRRG